MKNGNKVIEALKAAFPESRIEHIYYPEKKEECIYCNGMYIASFDEKFWQSDFDNIEIKIKAPLYNIKDFLEEVECDGVFYRAVERGLKEWEEELRANN